MTQTREMVSTAGGRHGMSPATLNEHEADTFGEHVFMNGLSPCSSFGGAVIVRLWPAAPRGPSCSNSEAFNNLHDNDTAGSSCEPIRRLEAVERGWNGLGPSALAATPAGISGTG